MTCRSLPPQVPFLDVLSDMTDPDLPLTQVEYEDWGNPSCPDDAAVIEAYAPYDNVVVQRYPSMLATGTVMRCAQWWSG